jgi:hypothetical protein
MNINHMDRLKIALLTCILIPTFCCAAPPYFGATASLPLLAKEPLEVHGYQFMLTFDPEKFQWRSFNVFFDGGVSYFWIPKKTFYHSLTILSAAPVVRYRFKPRGPITPYLDVSVGVAYLNHRYFDDRELGLHFAFQDRFGIGILFGKCDQFSLGIHSVHYSNANLGEDNSGVTVPILLDFGFRF